MKNWGWKIQRLLGWKITLSVKNESVKSDEIFPKWRKFLERKIKTDEILADKVYIYLKIGIITVIKFTQMIHKYSNCRNYFKHLYFYLNSLKYTFWLTVVTAGIYGKILRKKCLYDGKFSKVTLETYLESSSLLYENECEYVEMCIAHCMYTHLCQSISYHPKNKKCALFDKDLENGKRIIKPDKGWVHYQTDNSDKKVCF